MEHYIYGITPAEAVVLHKMHFQYSNGTPLKNLVIVGEATEVDNFGKPLQIPKREPFKRTIASINPEGQTEIKQVADFQTTYTPSTKPRTQAEETRRLQMKYTGNVTENGKTVKAWDAAFGGGAMVRLPETFEEIRHIIGDIFSVADSFKTETVTAQPEDEAVAPRRGRPPGVKAELAAQ